MGDTLQQYWQVGRKIKKIEKELLENINIRGVGYDSSMSDIVRRLEKLDRIVDRKFVVLIQGMFNSDKANIINALVGERILDEGILPSAATLYELHYGEEKKVISYLWNNGNWDESNAFFVKPTPDGIRKYRDKLMENKFSQYDPPPMCKLIIYWPLEILKPGLVLVALPEFIEESSLTWEYLPYTDVVIYLMNIAAAYSRKDKEDLQKFNTVDMKHIVTVFTRCDMLERMEKDEDDFSGEPEFDIEEIQQLMIQEAQKYSDLGTEAVHFVKNRDKNGILAAEDEEVMRQSGYPELKRYLNQMLMKECAVPRLAYCMKLLNEAVRDMNDSAEYRKYIMTDITQRMNSLWLELPFTSSELVDQSFRLLDRVLSRLEPKLAEIYKRQEEELNEKYQNPELHLAVIGNFNCGKSTFLNTILKQELLSMGNLPTTALPTYIRWDKRGGGEPIIITEDMEGERFNLSGSEIVRFERKTKISLPRKTGALIDSLTTDSKLIGKLKRVELSFPEEKKYENFCLIDTPGVNPGQEKDRDHILETQSVLRNDADAAIILFPSQQAYTASFRDFLLENAAHLMDDSIFIMTKVDTVWKESERVKVLNYVKKLLQNDFNLEEPEVYGISAGRALDYYMEEEAYAEDKCWAVGLEEVMDKIFQKLRDRRQEIISKRIREMVQELIHVVGEEVKTDTERLENNRKILIEYSLDSLEKKYNQLLETYKENLLCQKSQWILTVNNIVERRIAEAEAAIDYAIDQQITIGGLKLFINSELENVISRKNKVIIKDVNSNVSEKIRKRGHEFIEEVQSCLEEYQYYVGSAGDFFNKQRKGQNHPAPKLVSMPIKPQDQLSSMFDIVLEKIAFGPLLSILLMPLLGVAFMVDRYALPGKKLEIQQKISQELRVYSVTLKEEYRTSVNMQIEKNISWAQSLLSAYQAEYKLFFEKKKQEFDEMEQLLLNEIRENRNNLEEMERIETVLQPKNRDLQFHETVKVQ